MMRYFIILEMILGGGLFLHSVTAEANENPEPCINSCLRQHPKWGFPNCREVEFYLKGPACDEVFNDCLQECRFSFKPIKSARYIPGPTQMKDVWRQDLVCDPEVPKIPLDIPETDAVDPRLKGRCECRNGQLIEADCGHKKQSCKEVCNSDATF
ncbi:hypothetical protein WDW89_13455 [Deltaproteobacteria bacterium TL4]